MEVRERDKYDKVEVRHLRVGQAFKDSAMPDKVLVRVKKTNILLRGGEIPVMVFPDCEVDTYSTEWAAHLVELLPDPVLEAGG